MSAKTVVAKKREKTGKYNNRNLRKEGLIPAVIYGHDINESLVLNAKDFNKVFDSIKNHNIISVDIEGKKEDVLIKDYVEHPVTRKVIHVDFFKVNPDNPVTVRVPVVSKGLAKGVKTGGMLEQYLRFLKIKCKPGLIPAEVVVDVAELKLKYSVYVRDLDLGNEIEILSIKDQAIFTVISSRAAAELEEEASVEEETAAEA
jgi:large subunit ribosomal protein L25